MTKDLNNDRRRQLFALQAFRKMPAVLIVSQPDLFYFTGFTGQDSWAVLTARKSTVITDGRYTIQAKQESPRSRVVVRRGPMVQCLAETLKKLKIRRVAVFAEYVTVAVRDKLTEVVKGVRWKSVSADCVLDMRQIKSAEELRRIRKAVKIAQTSFLDVLAILKPGMTEVQVAAELEYRMRSAGADKPAFDTIVAFGKNSAKPHAVTGSTRIRAGKPVLFDFGGRFKGYCSDLTRTVWLGKISARFKEIYTVCLDAQMEAISAIKAGVPAARIDQIARKVISRAGYGKYFVHSLGHGIGLDVHENPALHTRSKTILQAGMVVTVEPGIYIPGLGGVRIEDDVLVQQNSCRVLSDLPKQIDEIML